MTFDELWPTLAIPGEYDAMDETDRARWRNVIRCAFEAGAEGKHYWWTLAHQQSLQLRSLREELLKERHDRSRTSLPD